MLKDEKMEELVNKLKFDEKHYIALLFAKIYKEKNSDVQKEDCMNLISFLNNELVEEISTIYLNFEFYKSFSSLKLNLLLEERLRKLVEDSSKIMDYTNSIDKNNTNKEFLDLKATIEFSKIAITIKRGNIILEELFRKYKE